MQGKRLSYFDMAKGLGIILVVYGHIEYISDEMRGWISSFHMPLFFIIAGMLMSLKNETEQEFKIFAARKWRSVMIPYLWFSLIYFFIDILNTVLNKIDLKTFIDNAIASVTFYGVSVLWFLPALFLSELFACAVIRYLRKWYLAIPVSFAAAILAYFIQIRISGFYDKNPDILFITITVNLVRVFLRALIAASFVVTGYFSFTLINRDEGFSVSGLITGIILFIADLFLYRINGCIDLHYMVLKNVPMFFICAFAGSFAIILICKNIRNVPVISYLGMNSLTIMCTHVNCYILYAAILIAWQIDRVVTRAKSYVFLFNIMFFTFLIEWAVIEIIKRFFPFILGKKMIKKQS